MAKGELRVGIPVDSEKGNGREKLLFNQGRLGENVAYETRYVSFSSKIPNAHKSY